MGEPMTNAEVRSEVAKIAAAIEAKGKPWTYWPIEERLRHEMARRMGGKYTKTGISQRQLAEDRPARNKRSDFGGGWMWADHAFSIKSAVRPYRPLAIMFEPYSPPTPEIISKMAQHGLAVERVRVFPSMHYPGRTELWGITRLQERKVLDEIQKADSRRSVSD